MRNLKKFLALVLAFMMAMSLMVTANAAVENGNSQFTDSETVTDDFVEDITVLNGMDIIKGYEDGTFGPSRSVTRAQMAAFVYRIATGDAADVRTHAYVGYSTFSDVNTNDWYAGYIGYCNNAEYIVGYPDGTFRPNANVTGYAALAMILRAMGYNEPGQNFTGTGWEVTVSKIATERGMLKNVNKTSYSANLKAAAPRELVAELVFQGLTTQTVQWTEAFGYQTSSAVTTFQTTTLGQKNYGLHIAKGIVVGNQSTGEAVTKIGIANEGEGGLDNRQYVDNGYTTKNSYVYAGVSNSSVTRSFDWESDLYDFGHAVSVWYNDQSNPGKLTTYAVFDRSTKSKVVNAATVDTTNSTVNQDANSLVLGESNSSPNVTTLSEAAWAEGFSVYANTHWNYSFGPTIAGNWGSSPSANAYSWTGTNDADFESPIVKNNSDEKYPLYLLISNSTSGANSLDLVVSLDLTVTGITQKNSTSGDPSVGVYTGNGQGNSALSPAGVAYFDKEDQIHPSVSSDDTKSYSNILTDALVGNSTQALGDKVVAIEVTGTTAGKHGRVPGDNLSNVYSDDGNSPALVYTWGGNYFNTTAPFFDGTYTYPLCPDSEYYYQLSKLTHVVPGTVSKINGVTQEVTLNNGTTLSRSVFAEAVDGDFQENSRVKAPTVYSTYNFYLDEEGKYIFWEELKNENPFVYGTYLDYATELNSSAYTYSMVGVDVNGEPIIVPSVTAYDTPWAPGQVAQVKFTNNTINSLGGYTNNPLPKRDSNGYNGYVQEGQYIGYTVDGSGVMKAITDQLSYNTGFQQASSDDFGSTAGTHMKPYTVGGTAYNYALKIGTDDVKIGAATVVSATSSYEPGLFLTTNTTIYLVSGAGTATQKVEKYAGIGELLSKNNADEVYIEGADAVRFASGSLKADGATGSATYADMIYFSKHPFTYAQNYVNSAYEVETIFIPKEAVHVVPNVSGNLVFVGDSKPGLINADIDAVQFTMYNNGVGSTYWIKGTTTSGNAGTIVTLGDNVFYNLKATNDKAHDGGVIYEIEEVSAKTAESLIGQYYTTSATPASIPMAGGPGASPVITKYPALYRATTYSQQVAFIDDFDVAAPANLWNVNSAQIVNLAPLTYPGIDNSLTSLNNAGSITSNWGVDVSCILGPDGVAVIYVNHV